MVSHIEPHCCPHQSAHVGGVWLNGDISLQRRGAEEKGGEQGETLEQPNKLDLRTKFRVGFGDRVVSTEACGPFSTT